MDLVVGDENSCRDAAVELGKAYLSDSIDDSKLPAGCFTIVTSSLHTKVYFNQKIDSSSTSPGPASAGICRRGMVVNDHRV